MVKKLIFHPCGCCTYNTHPKSYGAMCDKHYYRYRFTSMLLMWRSWG